MILSIILLSVLLLPPCYFLSEIFFRFGIYDITYVQMFIYLVLLMTFTLNLNKIRLNNHQKKILYLYILIAFILLVAALLYYDDPIDQEKIIRVHCKNIFIGLTLYCVINMKHLNLKKFNRIYIGLAILFSFFSLIIYIKYFFGFPLSIVTRYYKGENITVYLHELYGYFSYSEYGNMGIRGILPRSQSFWSEPSQFAQFLMFPLFLSLNDLLNNRVLQKLIIFILILFSLLLTFSASAFFGIISSTILCMYIYIARHKKIRISTKFLSAILLIFFLWLFFTFFKYTNTGNYGDTVLKKETSTNIFDRFIRIKYASQALNKGILGDIKIYRTYDRNSSAIGWLIMIAGIPGVILVLLILIIVFKIFIKNIINRKSILISIAFLSFFISHSWYGNYFGIEFLFILGLYLRLFKDKSLDGQK